MKNRDFRELQFSSSQLIFIFLAILALGIVIFLLGVSVGKKQTQIAKESRLSLENMIEQVKAEKPITTQEPEDSISKELASHQKIKEEVEEKPPAPPEKQNLYYVQVGAFENKKAALTFVETFKAKGFSTLVLDPFPSDRKDIYRVRLGGFQTKEQAEEAKAKILKPGTKKRDEPIIIRY